MSESMAFRDRVAETFRRREGEWVNGLELAQIGGAYAWRTRVSECRTQLGMVIQNRQRKRGRQTVSEYRFYPNGGQMSLFREGRSVDEEANRGL